MNSITVTAYGAPGSFVRRVQEQPAVAIDLLALAEQVAALNPAAGEIGAGKLAQLVATARQVVATATGVAS